VNDYDRFAEAYSVQNENNLVNAYCERPAVPALAGDVAGRRILDAGCDSGPLSAALPDRGAVVTGIDASAGMLALARRRLGAEVALHVLDLNDPCRSRTVRSTTWSRRWSCTTSPPPVSALPSSASRGLPPHAVNSAD
jgi:predicted TPR repeat methyltransferase